MDEFIFLQLWIEYTNSLDATNNIGGVEIVSCDNPGWWVKIDLNDTPFTLYHFDPVGEHVSPNKVALSKNWLYCDIEKGVFNGAGDPSKLRRILFIFMEWILNANIDLKIEYFDRLVNEEDYKP